jgi:hypothetical protein
MASMTIEEVEGFRKQFQQLKRYANPEESEICTSECIRAGKETLDDAIFVLSRLAREMDAFRKDHPDMV